MKKQVVFKSTNFTPPSILKTNSHSPAIPAIPASPATPKSPVNHLEESHLDFYEQKRLKIAFGMLEEDQKPMNETYDDKVQLIFEARANQVRLVSIFILFSNIMFQLSAINQLDSVNMRVIQSIYWVSTVISIVLLGKSIRARCVSTIKYCFILITLRMILRVYNIE